MSKAKKKQFELISNDLNIIDLIESLKINNSLYKKIINTLLSLGTFDKSINCNIYEIKHDEEQSYIKLWCEDVNGNIYIFCPKSNIKQELNIIQKISDDSEKKYDVTLSKKFDNEKVMEGNPEVKKKLQELQESMLANQEKENNE